MLTTVFQARIICNFTSTSLYFNIMFHHLSLRKTSKYIFYLNMIVLTKTNIKSFQDLPHDFLLVKHYKYSWKARADKIPWKLRRFQRFKVNTSTANLLSYALAALLFVRVIWSNLYKCSHNYKTFMKCIYLRTVIQINRL